MNVYDKCMINAGVRIITILQAVRPVSYTHLDVYKRQIQSDDL